MKKPPLPESPGIPERSLFLPLALFHDLREPQPQSSPTARPSFYPPWSSQPSARPLSVPLRLGPESRKTRPPPPDSLSPHRPTSGCPAPESALLLLPSSRYPDQLFGRSECARLLEGRGLMPARLPRPSAPSRRGFWLHARLPRAAQGCASRFAPKPPGAPQPSAQGEGGREGGGEGAWGGARLRERPHCPGLPHPLLIPGQPLTAGSFSDAPSTPAVVLPPVCSGDGSARTVSGLNFSALA